MITSGMKRRIKREWSAQKPTVWVGKEGATTKITNHMLPTSKPYLNPNRGARLALRTHKICLIIWLCF